MIMIPTGMEWKITWDTLRILLGGVRSGDFAAVGSYGGLTVTNLASSGGNGVSLTVSGKTTNGNSVMMTFNGASGRDHAVVVTGVASDGTMSYYDPTTNSNGTRNPNNYSGLYEVEN